MGLTNLTTTFQVSFAWNAQQAITGQAYNPVTNVGRISKATNNGTGSANTTTGGSDEIISKIIPIAQATTAGTTSVTFDLQNINNILQTAGISLARVKGFLVQLLSLTDDTVNGSNCAEIMVGGGTGSMGAGSFTPHNLDGMYGTITATTNANPDVLTFSPAPPPDGSRITISGATGDTAINGNFNTFGTSGYTAKLTSLGSTGGSTVVAGNGVLSNTPVWSVASVNRINNGGVKSYFDTTSLGLLVSGNQHIVTIVNCDQTTSAGVQITFVGGTT